MNGERRPAACHDSGDSSLQVRRMFIDTYQEAVAYMRADCAVCRAEGFEAQSRILVRLGQRSVIATLNVVGDMHLAPGEVGLSEAAWHALAASHGERVSLGHPRPLLSFGAVRAKLYGNRLTREAMAAIVNDIAAGNYSDIETVAFLAACAGGRMDLDEIVDLTLSMVHSGQRMAWDGRRIMDKHCVGGLPGNRTTLVVVPIVAACGLVIPKTSSRAITSPAGTADTMETLAPVDLSAAQMRRVVEQEGGCICWGGAMNLSPVDDMLIRLERPLDLDSEGQLVASILSKKLAAGATDVLIDIPVGPTAKVRSRAAAELLSGLLVETGRRVGLHVQPLFTDGSQPVGRGIGPALEARDVLAVLRNAADAPADLRDRALTLAGHLIAMAGLADSAAAERLAAATLADGRAWQKFQAICSAQGGMREPARAGHRHVMLAAASGTVAAIDNRRLARIAKLAGAPKAAAAGVLLCCTAGQRVAAGQPLYEIHAESPGELAYAHQYAQEQGDTVLLRDGPAP